MKKVIYCSEYSFVSLEDVQNAKYDPVTETGDPTWLETESGDTYIKYGKNKWLKNSKQNNVISNGISDEQLYDKIKDQKVKMF